MHPRAIETRYKGYRFRSRLEARWAVFFDALGLRWEYEPEGFELPGGVRYLPDFKIGGMWFEVKPPGGDDTKAKLLAAQGEPVCLLDGPPDLKAYVLWWVTDDSGAVRENNLIFMPDECKYSPYYTDTGCADRREFPRLEFEDVVPSILCAISAARGARFEHGESGARA